MAASPQIIKKPAPIPVISTGAERSGEISRPNDKKAGPRPPSFRPKRSGVEKSHSTMVQEALGWEISRLRVSSKRFPSVPYRHASPLEMTMLASAPLVISTEAKRSGEISRLNGQESGCGFRRWLFRRAALPSLRGAGETRAPMRQCIQRLFPQGV